MNQPPLSELLGRRTPLRLPPPPDFTQLRRSVERVLERHGRAEPPERNPERLLAEMARRIETDDWTRVPMSFATRTARVAFSADWRDRKAFDPVRTFLLAEIEASTRTGFLNPMVRIYLENFAADAPAIRRLGHALARSSGKIGAQWRQLLENVPRLFDPASAPTDLAERMDGMEDIWNGLRKLGIRQPHAPGLMADAHLALIRRLAPRLDRAEDIERLLSWLRPQGHEPLSAGAPEAIGALLAHWLRRSPPEDVKRLLVERLTEFYGHPKANRNAVWNTVPEECERLFLHWITGAHIRLLFRILAEVEQKHMWRDREDFWWTLYEQGRLDEVWIAFNPEGYRAALSRLPPETRESSVPFGRQVGEKDKSLLIMRIGHKIVVEGTYNFKVHIFDIKSPSAPKLYLRKYDVADLRSRRGAESRAHHGDAWQSWVRQRI
ncbi:hypothetical protein JMM63_16515 [Rhodovulum sulfidophilum]|uniref:EH signature domain-containing protein n=1 Tax=Rhodovulum sulfidophilum TaxID=35806 RepID=UPI001921F276|nr:EH signature domain-containing protein [Rhodovulum sulfidophilum]MBL3597152.1 hypothetical protein [Rhodovulum sulfidophilum]